jgi:hypothetical protein
MIWKIFIYLRINNLELRKNKTMGIVVGDRQYGPYGFIHSFEEEDGHAVAQVQSGNLPPIGWQDRIYDDMGDQSLFYVVDGREIGKGYEDIGDQYIFVDGKFAFSASKNGKTFIVYDGEETAIEGISLSSRLYNIQGKLAYYIKNPDGSGSLRLMMGGQNVGPKIPADGNFSLSNGGKVAIQTKNANGDTVVYLDGKEVYQSKVPIDLHSDLKFFGEKIFFLIHGGKISIPWYDGKKIGQNFYGYDYFTLVNGKLDFVAFDEGEKQYYLILEK